MKKCLLLKNASSGNAKRADNKKINNKLLSIYNIVDEIQVENIIDFDVAKKCEGYDALCFSGGDGTLNFVINAVRNLEIDLLYYPSGTVNDFARTIRAAKKKQKSKEHNTLTDLGEFNGLLFSYVAAAGTFTSIGYTPAARRKKVFKRLAYWFSALKEFRSHKIKAKIDIDGRCFEDTYTLIMAAKSEYIFGFRVNKAYKHNSGKGHLLLIKTPAGALKRVKLFCRFFRAFCIGFKKQKDSGKIKFLEFANVAVDFEKEQNFCVDGEKCVSEKRNEITVQKEKLNIALL